MLSLVDGDFDWQALSQSVVTRHATCFSDLSMSRGVASIYDAILKVPATARGSVLPLEPTTLKLER